MEIYAIEADDLGRYQVRVTSPGGRDGRMVAGFRTVSQAQEWIDDRMRLTAKPIQAPGAS